MTNAETEKVYTKLKVCPTQPLVAFTVACYGILPSAVKKLKKKNLVLEYLINFIRSTQPLDYSLIKLKRIYTEVGAFLLSSINFTSKVCHNTIFILLIVLSIFFVKQCFILKFFWKTTDCSVVLVSSVFINFRYLLFLLNGIKALKKSAFKLDKF